MEEAPPTCEDNEEVEAEELVVVLLVVVEAGAVSHWGALHSVVTVSTFAWPPSVCVLAWAR